MTVAMRVSSLCEFPLLTVAMRVSSLDSGQTLSHGPARKMILHHAQSLDSYSKEEMQESSLRRFVSKSLYHFASVSKQDPILTATILDLATVATAGQSAWRSSCICLQVTMSVAFGDFSCTCGTWSASPSLRCPTACSWPA